MEAGPVQALVDDALLKLRLLETVTDACLEQAEELSGLVGDEIATALESHRAALEDQEPYTAELTASQVARTLQKNAEAYRALQERFPVAEESPALDVPSFAGLIAALKAAGEVARRRLTTTLEEENGRKAQFDLAVDRERKAAKELQTLERQLASEREDRAAVVSTLTAAEARARRDLSQATNSHETAMADLQQTKVEQEGIANASFQTNYSALQAEVTRLQSELEATSRGHKEEETSWRKKRNKAEQEVANWLSEYDKDMGAREAVLEEERAAYAALSKRLAETLEQVAKLKEARVAHEKAERERRQALFMVRQKQRIQERAARVIQSTWKVHQASKPKPAKAEKEGKGDKKGKKK